MQQWPLYPHPQNPSPPVSAMQAQVSVQADLLHLGFDIQADLAALRWPADSAPAFRDGLWRHSCLELFAAGGGAAYREFNFSPSSEFAAYDFDGYREGMRPVHLDVRPAISWHCAPGRIRIDIHLPLRFLAPAPAAATLLAVAAVLEHGDATLSYWALRHPGPRPDFHHRDGFIAPCPTDTRSSL